MQIYDIAMILLRSGCAIEWDGEHFRAQIGNVWVVLDDVSVEPIQQEEELAA
jgi:hypothetical protein